MARARWIRIRVSGTLALVGWVLVCIGLFPSMLDNAQLWVDGMMGVPRYYIALLPWGATLLVLAVRPIDWMITSLAPFTASVTV